MLELVERARDGDRNAFGELYRLYHAPVFRLARFHLAHAAAQDAVSETFLRAWLALPRYRSTGAPFVAWLYGIARHVVADLRAVGRRVEPRAEPPDRALDDRADLDERLALAEALGRIGADQRRVIELKFLMGLSNSEVGAALGKSAGAVNAQQWRALAALHQEMGEEMDHR